MLDDLFLSFAFHIFIILKLSYLFLMLDINTYCTALLD